MKQRIITGVLAFSLLAIIFVVGTPAIIGLVFLVNLVGLYEFLKTIGAKTILDYLVPMVFGTLILVAQIFIGINSGIKLEILSLAAICIFVVNILSKKHDVTYAVFSIFGIIYVSLFLSYAVGILNLPNGIGLILSIIILCICCDSFAYFIGVKFGKRKLCPTISPKKSVEGSIAGFVSTVIASGVICLVFNAIHQESYSLAFFLIAGVIIGVVSQFGDLSASLIKRKFDKKDYGNLLPGHGGILDRIDSMLFSFASIYLYIKALMYLSM